MSFIFKHNNTDFELINYGIKDKLYFKAKSVAQYLGYKNTKQAIIDHVWSSNKTTIELCGRDLIPQKNKYNTIYLNEYGMYQLIFASKMDIAQKFQRWVIEYVLPSIRKTGQFSLKNQTVKPNLTFKIDNEFDLHKQIVNFCKVQYPEILLIVQSGELQDTRNKRSQEYFKGYESVSFDIIINNLHKKYNGFCIEFKTPTGKGIISQKQLDMQKKYESNNYKTLITNDYNKCIFDIIEYMRDVRIKCIHCKRRFKNSSTLSNHYKYFHRITRF